MKTVTTLAPTNKEAPAKSGVSAFFSKITHRDIDSLDIVSTTYYLFGMRIYTHIVKCGVSGIPIEQLLSDLRKDKVYLNEQQ